MVLNPGITATDTSTRHSRKGCVRRGTETRLLVFGVVEKEGSAEAQKGNVQYSGPESFRPCSCALTWPQELIYFTEKRGRR